MALPLKYNLRDVLVGWRSTIVTILGISLAVAVLVLRFALARAIETSSANTGDPRNILVVRKGSQAESGSIVTRDQFRTLQYLPEIARNEVDRPVVSAELVLIVSVPRRDGSGEANTLLRGITSRGIELRPQVRLTEGRRFGPGKGEVDVASRLAARFAVFEICGPIKGGPARLKVVGPFDGQSSAFDSEAWMDADEARAVFDRENYSSVLLRPKDAAAAAALPARIENDKRLALRAESEVEYYKKQTMTAIPIKILAALLGTAMAVCAAMNTMYASVATRTREIGTLRVLGFSRRSIVFSFLIEGAFLATLGGAVGSAIAWLLYGYVRWRGIYFGTVDLQSFAETVFQFRVTADLMMLGAVFSTAIGLVGSLLPALRAARLPVIAALKSV